jgi:hypothetical protein
MKRLIVVAATAALLAGQAQAAAPKKAHAAEAPAAAKGWYYKSGSDPMGAQWHLACVRSNDVVKLAAPYHATKALLCIRYEGEPPRADDTVVSIGLVDGGQILSDEGIDVRYDQAAPTHNAGSAPVDGSSSRILFSENYEVARKLRHTSHLVVGLTFFQNGKQYLEFDTSNLNMSPLTLFSGEAAARAVRLDDAKGDQAKIDAINAEYDCIAAGREDCPK